MPSALFIAQPSAKNLLHKGPLTARQRKFAISRMRNGMVVHVAHGVIFVERCSVEDLCLCAPVCVRIIVGRKLKD